MSEAVERPLAEAHRIVEDEWQQVKQLLSDELQPRAKELLFDATMVEIRAAAGEDVESARIAIEASMRNLPRIAKADFQLRARSIAVRAAFEVLGALLG